MFERYNEKARRTIFFARYEASQFGSPYIEIEFMLLGLMREDPTLSMRFLRSATTAEEIRREIERHRQSGDKISTAVDLPLSNESKHVLAHAAEEAERLAHQFISTEHLFLGILREQNSFAGQLLQRYGINLDEVRKDIASRQPPVPGSRATGRRSTVTVTGRPASTRRSTSLVRFRSSRTATSSSSAPECHWISGISTTVAHVLRSC